MGIAQAGDTPTPHQPLDLLPLVGTQGVLGSF